MYHTTWGKREYFMLMVTLASAINHHYFLIKPWIYLNVVNKYFIGDYSEEIIHFLPTLQVFCGFFARLFSPACCQM